MFDCDQVILFDLDALDLGPLGYILDAVCVSDSTYLDEVLLLGLESLDLE